MTRHRLLPRAALGAALMLGACTGTAAQKGDSDNQGFGTTPEEQQGTIVNDTTPHRPGAPAGPPSPE